MLLAYIDEIGETGAFISRTHPRFKTSPAFRYAGFVIPEDRARQFGAIFTAEKRRLFATEIVGDEKPEQWERKGSEIFRRETHRLFPQQVRVFNSLVRKVRSFGGHLFYYADEKPIGTPRETKLDTGARETIAMRETLNRLARHADSVDLNIMVIIDQVNENQRSARLPNMYGHILGRATDFVEMRRIIEPPMHVDSQLSSNIQFADWVAACTTRAIEYQLIDDAPCGWVATTKAVDAVRGAFTHESKLHLWHRSVDDLVHSGVFNAHRVLHPIPTGQLVSASIELRKIQKVKAAAERASTKKKPR